MFTEFFVCLEDISCAIVAIQIHSFHFPSPFFFSEKTSSIIIITNVHINSTVPHHYKFMQTFVLFILFHSCCVPNSFCTHFVVFLNVFCCFGTTQNAAKNQKELLILLTIVFYKGSKKDIKTKQLWNRR